MSAIGDLLGVSPDLSSGLHNLFGATADKLRATAKVEVSSALAGSSAGQHAISSTVTAWWDAYKAPVLLAVVGVLLALLYRAWKG